MMSRQATTASKSAQNMSSVKTENVNVNMENVMDIVDDVKYIVKKMKSAENEDPNTSVYVDMVKIGEVNASLNLQNVMMNVALAQNVTENAEGSCAPLVEGRVNLLTVFVCPNVKTNGVGGDHGQNAQVRVDQMASKPGREDVGPGRVHVRDPERTSGPAIDKNVLESG